MTLQTRAAAFASRIGLTGLAIAVLLLLLAVQTVRIEGFKVWPISVDGYKARLHDAREARRSCEARLGTSNDSIGLLQRVIAGRNKEIEARAAEFAAAKQQADARQAELERQAVASNDRIARLREIADRPARPGQCATPAELRELAEGL